MTCVLSCHSLSRSRCSSGPTVILNVADIVASPSRRIVTAIVTRQAAEVLRSCTRREDANVHGYRCASRSCTASPPKRCNITRGARRPTSERRSAAAPGTERQAASGRASGRTPRSTPGTRDRARASMCPPMTPAPCAVPAPWQSSEPATARRAGPPAYGSRSGGAQRPRRRSGSPVAYQACEYRRDRTRSSRVASRRYRTQETMMRSPAVPASISARSVTRDR